MMALAHAGLGWVVGLATPNSDRRLRIWCVVAALVPDLDALAFLGGAKAEAVFRYGFGHNIFACVLLLVAAIWFFRGEPVRMLFTTLFLVATSFFLHLLLDLKVTGAPIRLFWPINQKALQLQPLLVVGRSIEFLVACALLALPWALAFWKWATPLEILSPRLDTLFLNLIRHKKYACTICGKKCNNRCTTCTRPVCFGHGKIGRGFRLTCATCAAGSAPKGTGEGIEDYVARELQFLRSKEAVRLDVEFSSFLYRKLRDGLRRLDDIPRDHPIWQGSDQRPTMAKLVDLSRTVLKDSPDDVETRWVLFGHKILSSSPDLEYSIIEPAILSDFASIRWLASAARWSYLFSGVDPVVALRAPLESLGKSVGPLEPFLGTLAEDKDPAMKEAAARLLDLLRGRNPFKS
jgi:membrane-bound metal-dependent hydrolase YbcI (DUF457 family)